MINFRCHLNAKYIFKNGKVTLLAGEPEAGKTTIFQAIFWALYGSLRNINHHLNSDTSRTEVTLTFTGKPQTSFQLDKGITVYRQNHSNRLILTIAKQQYEGETAQNQINQIFGKRDVWKSVSYIEQGTQCSLLTGNKQERLALLESLSFHDQNPEIYIAKIDQELNRERERFKLDQNSYQTEFQILNQELEIDPLPKEYDYTSKYQLEFQDQLKRLYREYSIQEQNDRKRSQLRGALEQLQKSKNSFMNQILSVNPDSILNYKSQRLSLSQELEEIKKEINLEKVNLEVWQKDYERLKQDEYLIIGEKKRSQEKLDQLENLKKSHLQRSTFLETEGVKLKDILKELEKEAISLDKVPPREKCPTWLEVGQIKQIEKERAINISKAISMGFEYNDKIPSEIRTLEGKLEDKRRLLERSERVNSLISQEQELIQALKEIDVPKFSNTDSIESVLENLLKLLSTKTNDLSKMVHEKEAAMKLLSCPECGVSLRLEKNRLTSDSRKPSNQGEVIQLSNQLEKIVSTNRLLLNFKEALLKEKSSNISIYETFLNETRKAVVKREGLPWVLPVPDQKIDVQKIKNKMNKIIAKVSNLSQIIWIPLPTIPSKVLEREIRLREIFENEEQLKQICHSLESIKDEVLREESNLRKIEESLLETSRRLEEIKNSRDVEISRLSSWEKREREIYSSLNKCQEEIIKLEYQVENQKSISRELENVTKEIEDIKIKLNNMDINRLSEVSAQIKEKESILKIVERGIKLREWQSKLSEKNQEILRQQELLSSLEDLRQTAEKVQYSRLKETITSINNAMNHIFTEIFDNEMCVELKLFKEFKTTGNIKPQVNCLIHYKGTTYNNLNTICGSEKNRLNLGMILALNLVSTSPLILLDECTSFLNARLKSKAVRAITQTMQTFRDKIVICICHQSNEADYEEIVPV